MALKRTIKQEMTYGGNLLPKAYAIYVWKLPVLKFFLFWLAAIIYSGQSNFKYEYLGEFETEFENILGYESGDQLGSVDEKYQWYKSLATVPLRFRQWIHVLIDVVVVYSWNKTKNIHFLRQHSGYENYFSIIYNYLFHHSLSASASFPHCILLENEQWQNGLQMLIPSMAAVLGFSLDSIQEAYLLNRLHLEVAHWKLQHVHGSRVDSRAAHLLCVLHLGVARLKTTACWWLHGGLHPR